MITKEFPDILSCWRGLVDELAYKSHEVGALRWGVCIAYPDLVEVKIENALVDRDMHLDMSSYTKSRWTRFLRRYFRIDLHEWIGESITKMTKYPSRPFVCGYSVNPNIADAEGRMGHNYGGCLSSLQIRICPSPEVILYSRACQMDKIGFLDMSLIHVVARTMIEHPYLKNRSIVKGRWVVSLPFISAISQVYYTQRFKLPMKGHALERRVRQNRVRLEENVTFGPLRRLIKRNRQMKELGHIPGSCAVKDLTLQFVNAKEK